MHMQIYKYVGSRDLIVPEFTTARHTARSFLNSFATTLPGTMTFIVDLDGELWVADRHSEHVACARGNSVLAAGEVTFAVDEGEVSVVEVTNLSTGYCPEPACWKSIQAALDSIGVNHPGYFTSEYQFRRCIACGMRNLIKDECYRCDVCGADLPVEWNFGEQEMDIQS